MEKLINEIEKKVMLNPELKSKIPDFFSSEVISKNHQILREDQYADKLYFLESGVVRTYYYHQNKEITSWLYGENHFFYFLV